MVRALVTALALCLTLSGCGMFGGDKPAPAPVAQVQPEPTPPPPPPPPPAPLTHRLKKGETIATVAKKYGVPAGQLLAANNLRSAKGVRSGTELIIPNKFVSPDPIPAPAPTVKEVQEKEPKGAGKVSKSDPYGIEAATKPTKGKKKLIPIDDDSTFEKIKAEFNDYAAKWLQKSQSLSESNKGHKTVTQEDGRYVASYAIIQLNTMQTEVKRVDYDDTPYVGHITYELEVHRTFGNSAQAAMASQAEEVKHESMREIFSYSRQKRAWR